MTRKERTMEISSPDLIDQFFLLITHFLGPIIKILTKVAGEAWSKFYWAAIAIFMAFLITHILVTILPRRKTKVLALATAFIFSFLCFFPLNVFSGKKAETGKGEIALPDKWKEKGWEKFLKYNEQQAKISYLPDGSIRLFFPVLNDALILPEGCLSYGMKKFKDILSGKEVTFTLYTHYFQKRDGTWDGERQFALMSKDVIIQVLIDTDPDTIDVSFSS